MATFLPREICLASVPEQLSSTSSGCIPKARISILKGFIFLIIGFKTI
jgi:hypothetical protein